MLIFNIFFPVITGSNHGVGECDHIEPKPRKPIGFIQPNNDEDKK